MKIVEICTKVKTSSKNRRNGFCVLMIALIFSGGILHNDNNVAAQQEPETEVKAETKIPAGLAKRLEHNVIAPLNAGNDKLFQAELAKVISKIDSSAIERIEQFGQSSGVASLRTEFFNIWKSDIIAGRVRPDVKLKQRVIFYLSAGMVDAVEELTKEIAAHEIHNTEELPQDWRQNRTLFLKIESLRGRITELETMGEFVAFALEDYKDVRKPKKEVTDTLTAFQNAAQSFSAAKKSALEKEAVLRLRRFSNGAKILMEKQGDFETRVVAALFLEEDINELEAFFASNSQFDAPELNEPDLFETTQETINAVRSSKSPEIEKAGLLAQGLYQWRRGRYGMGTTGNGLLRSKPISNRPWRRFRAFQPGPVLMPENPAVISEFLGSDSGDGFERRHYFTWDLEYRPLTRSLSTDMVRESSSRETGRSAWVSEELVCGGVTFTQHSRNIDIEDSLSSHDIMTISGSFAAQDNTIPPRIVGTIEYSSALNFLEKLVDSSTPEQIEIYDKLIAEMPEFAFYSGMTANVNPQPVAAVKPSKLAHSQFKKQSLAWLMALAKVELAATRSMYVPGGESFLPPANHKFGASEYYQVLLDDVAVHLNAIDKDDQFKRAIKKSFKKASSATLSYLRRLKLVGSMLVALEQSGEPEIATLSAAYREQVTELNASLEGQVARSIQDQVLTSNHQSNVRNRTQREVINEVHQ